MTYEETIKNLMKQSKKVKKSEVFRILKDARGYPISAIKTENIWLEKKK